MDSLFPLFLYCWSYRSPFQQGQGWAKREEMNTVTGLLRKWGRRLIDILDVNTVSGLSKNMISLGMKWMKALQQFESLFLSQALPFVCYILMLFTSFDTVPHISVINHLQTSFHSIKQWNGLTCSTGLVLPGLLCNGVYWGLNQNCAPWNRVLLFMVFMTLQLRLWMVVQSISPSSELCLLSQLQTYKCWVLCARIFFWVLTKIHP